MTEETQYKSVADKTVTEITEKIAKIENDRLKYILTAFLKSYKDNCSQEGTKILKISSLKNELMGPDGLLNEPLLQTQDSIIKTKFLLDNHDEHIVLLAIKEKLLLETILDLMDELT